MGVAPLRLAPGLVSGSLLHAELVLCQHTSLLRCTLCLSPGEGQDAWSDWSAAGQTGGLVHCRPDWRGVRRRPDWRGVRRRPDWRGVRCRPDWHGARRRLTCLVQLSAAHLEQQPWEVWRGACGGVEGCTWRRRCEGVRVSLKQTAAIYTVSCSHVAALCLQDTPLQGCPHLSLPRSVCSAIPALQHA